MKILWHKVSHWEYWPFFLVYFPLFFAWIYFSIKAKSFFFFNACNPKIKNGGMMAESKKEIYDLLPSKLYPKTILVEYKTKFHLIKENLQTEEFSFPLITKPDIGLKGSGVKKIDNPKELGNYHSKANFDYLIQDLIPFENEVGIFYVRFPNEKKGKITGIIKKEFVIIEGDGNLTIKELIQKNPRYEMQIENIKKEFGFRFDEVLKKGKKINLVPYGNHIRGAKFLDYSHLISQKLTQTIDAVCQKIPEFYFGRLDIMYQSWGELENGNHFSIVEVNGAGSEPTHIYDPKNSLFFAWKELFRHLNYMNKISIMNHKNGFDYLHFKEGIKQLNIHFEQTKKFIHF